MAFDNATLLRQTAQEIIDGLRKEQGAFADMVCTRRTRQSIKGTEPYRASKDTLAQDLGSDAIGADPQNVNLNMSSLDWDMVQYSRMVALSTGELTDLNQYFDVLSEYMETLKDYTDVAVDVDLSALLTSGTYNNAKAAAAGNWSSSSSTPILDMQNGLSENCPGADMVIIGQTSAFELARHPDITATVANYSSGHSIGFGQLKAAVGNALNLSPANVHIFGSFYDSANAGQALNLAYAAGDLCWMGYKRGLSMVEQPLDESVKIEEIHQRVEISESRNLELVRTDKELGVYITGL